ncbi:HAMP domain-containing histidine kinase [Clostridiaceae bacterium NSJ-31]|uniref:histidine kinase n=1 Tax=Ligaoa zhengdingensis TaxID=2763658 RepID=A0A926DZ83_9FIRM|nr:HAMP domain-containing sensor histidine kinase [Ligaoa zhengdingensis]MBC8546643.1 HAMP domain-containing histidine kinase [Ligaoa zhengdingensis]
MRKLPVKAKITAWVTLLLILLGIFLLSFMLLISNSVTRRTAMSQLTQTVQSSLKHISRQQDRLVFADDFKFYQNGVSLLIYSQSEALLAGQLPLSFTAQEPFQNGITRSVQVGDGEYLVMDLWAQLDWENGVWVRGLLEAPKHRQVTHNMLRIALISLPTFALLAALGGWRIVQRAFRPLDSITATASAINEAKDLSGRIDLPPGRDEFSRLAQTFNQMFERLERSFEAEKQFTADASHELRTPVSVIKSACEYAEQFDETPEERQETIEMIHRQAEKMSAMISQLLSMTRLDQGIESVRMEPVDVKKLVLSTFEEKAYNQDRLRLKLSEQIQVQADPVLLSRLLVNLVDNALQYGKVDGPVEVLLRREQGEILLSVRDEGDGIPLELQEKIWERFYQADPSRSGGGAGLGLSMVRQIAQVLGGYMELKSAPGKGSIFTLHLPDQL